MENNSFKLNPFSKKTLSGISKVSKKLIQNSAKKDRNLIVADINENPISIAAKKLLKSLKP